MKHHKIYNVIGGILLLGAWPLLTIILQKLQSQQSVAAAVQSEFVFHERLTALTYPIDNIEGTVEDLYFNDLTQDLNSRPEHMRALYSGLARIKALSDNKTMSSPSDTLAYERWIADLPNRISVSAELADKVARKSKEVSELNRKYFKAFYMLEARLVKAGGGKKAADLSGDEVINAEKNIRSLVAEMKSARQLRFSLNSDLNNLVYEIIRQSNSEVTRSKTFSAIVLSVAVILYLGGSILVIVGTWAEIRKDLAKEAKIEEQKDEV